MEAGVGEVQVEEERVAAGWEEAAKVVVDGVGECKGERGRMADYSAQPVTWCHTQVPVPT